METSKSRLAYQYLVESFHASDSTGIQNWLNKMGELGFKFAHAYEYGGWNTSKMSVITLMKEYENPDVSTSLITFDKLENNQTEQRPDSLKSPGLTMGSNLNQGFKKIINPSISKNPFGNTPPNSDVPF
jgi:hypothetical protein